MKPYTVKSGDTLLGIAVEQQVDYLTMLELNPPCQSNPDLIHPGQIINLPEFEPEEASSLPPVEPVEAVRPVCETGIIEDDPACKGIDVHEVVMITGDRPENYYCLDDFAKERIEEEIAAVERLMSDLKKLNDKAPTSDNASKSDLEKYRQKKQLWLEHANHAGLIERAKTQSEHTKSPKTTQKKIRNDIASLREQQRFIQGYSPLRYLHFSNFVSGTSVKALKDQRVKDIQGRIGELGKLQEKAEDNGSPPEETPEVEPARAASKGETATFGIVEVMIVSQNRLVYLRQAFILRERERFWKTNPVQTALKKAVKNNDPAAIGKAIVKDIKDGIMKDAAKSPLGNLEQVWATWPLGAEWKLAEWKSTSPLLMDRYGNTVIAINSEAQLMRFVAQATVNSELDLAKGKVDLGIRADAEFALAQGKINAEAYFPYQTGYPLSLTYTDANGLDALYSFGSFRCKLALELSCFVGARVSVDAGASAQWKEQPSGASMLVSPNLEVGKTRGGNVGIKANGFAGAEVGGSLAGALEWEHPDKINLDQFKQLAEVKADGKAMAGAGAGIDFGLTFERGEFRFNCSGTLVFGPGASGGFGTTVNVDQLWDLAQVLWDGLEKVDYRKMANLDGPSYAYFVQASYMAFINPTNVLANTVIKGGAAVEEWWLALQRSRENSENRRLEAEAVAKSILNNGTYSGLRAQYLPPETIGMLLDTLVRTYLSSKEETQEKAIVTLLSNSIKSWRKFEEVLAHMTEDGNKKPGNKALFKNLDRLNAILDEDQQDEFDIWVGKLVDKTITLQSENILAYTEKKAADKKAAVQANIERYKRHYQ